MNLLDYCQKSGDNCKSFHGEKKYIATGDIIDNSIVSSTNVTFDNKPSRANVIAKPGEIIIAKMKNTIKVLLIDETSSEYIFSTGFYCIKPDVNKVLPKYLYYYFLSDFFNNQKDKYCSGATMKAINDKGLKRISANFPQIDIQKKLIEKLDKLYQMKENTFLSINELEQYEKSLFYESFGTPMLNEKGFEISNIESCCQLVTDGSHFSPKDMSVGYPMLSVKDMRRNSFNFSECKYIDEETFDKMKKQGCVPQKNDLLISKDGSYFAYGFIYNDDKEVAILSSIAILRADFKKIMPEYLRMYLMSDEIVNVVTRNYVTGTALKRVILKGVKKIPIMIPDIVIQKSFAEKYNNIEKGIICLENNLNDINDLIQSYSNECFS